MTSARDILVRHYPEFEINEDSLDREAMSHPRITGDVALLMIEDALMAMKEDCAQVVDSFDPSYQNEKKAEESLGNGVRVILPRDYKIQEISDRIRGITRKW